MFEYGLVDPFNRLGCSTPLGPDVIKGIEDLFQCRGNALRTSRGSIDVVIVQSKETRFLSWAAAFEQRARMR